MHLRPAAAYKSVLMFCSCLAAALFFLLPVNSTAAGIYPKGTDFPLVLYSIDDPQDMQQVKQFGWNGVHTYGFKPDRLDLWKSASMYGLVPLHGEQAGDHWKSRPEADVTKEITTYSASPNILWWDIHEERRYWIPDEMDLIAKYSIWTRKYDPQRRPNYMYIPGHYAAQDVKPYVPYLDVIPASVYTTYALMPHAWVRWRMESTVKGIELAGATIGPDYLHGEKTPVAILELFYEQYDPQRPPKVMTPEGAYHDFWQCIVSGARGIMIFSYFHRNDPKGQPTYQQAWQAYCKAASQITGSEKLGQMILQGKKLSGVTCKVTSGPEKTVEFVPDGLKPPAISYPSVDVLAKTWNKQTYVIVVNSAEENVTVRISGLPMKAKSASVLFESQTLPVNKSTMECTLAPLGVHIFKM